MSDATDLFQVHLNKKGMSKRAVRYAVLPMSKVESAEKAAAVNVTKDSIMAEYQSNVEKLGLEMMVRQVSEPCEPDKLHEARWTTVGPADLAVNWSSYFGVKDTAMLRAIYRNEHVVTQAEAEEILAGKIAITED